MALNLLVHRHGLASEVDALHQQPGLSRRLSTGLFIRGSLRRRLPKHEMQARDLCLLSFATSSAHLSQTRYGNHSRRFLKVLNSKGQPQQCNDPNLPIPSNELLERGPPQFMHEPWGGFPTFSRILANSSFNLARAKEEPT